jgi:hypothetical protein
MDGGSQMAHNFTCPLCRMNHRQIEPGICRFCSAKIERLTTFPGILALQSTEDLIRAKDAAGLSLNPIEYAIARVRMQPNW